MRTRRTAPGTLRREGPSLSPFVRRTPLDGRAPGKDTRHTSANVTPRQLWPTAPRAPSGPPALAVRLPLRYLPGRGLARRPVRGPRAADRPPVVPPALGGEGRHGVPRAPPGERDEPHPQALALRQPRGPPRARGGEGVRRGRSGGGVPRRPLPDGAGAAARGRLA